MPENITTLVSSLLSGLIGVLGALGGVYLNNRNQSSQRTTELLRERGEELYSNVFEWLDGLFFFSLRRCGVMRGQITYNECLEQDIEWEKNKRTAPTMLRLEMLIDVYFPATRHIYDEIVQLRSNLNRIEAEFKRGYENGFIDGREFLKPYLDTQKEIEAAGTKLQKQVIEEIRKID